MKSREMKVKISLGIYRGSSSPNGKCLGKTSSIIGGNSFESIFVVEAINGFL